MSFRERAQAFLLVVFFVNLAGSRLWPEQFPWIGVTIFVVLWFSLALPACFEQRRKRREARALVQPPFPRTGQVIVPSKDNWRGQIVRLENSKITLETIPKPDASFEELAIFALSMDGDVWQAVWAEGHRSPYWTSREYVSAADKTLTVLRCELFGVFHGMKWNQHEPRSAFVPRMQKRVEKIREHLINVQTKAAGQGSSNSPTRQ